MSVWCQYFYDYIHNFTFLERDIIIIIQGVSEWLLQKYFLLTSHRKHHKTKCWMENFTGCRTFWYLVSKEHIGFLIKSNLPRLLKAWFWRCQKSQFWIFWVGYISVQEPPIFNPRLCPNNRNWIMGFGDKTILFLVISEPKYSKIRHF